MPDRAADLAKARTLRETAREFRRVGRTLSLRRDAETMIAMADAYDERAAALEAEHAGPAAMAAASAAIIAASLVM